MPTLGETSQQAFEHANRFASSYPEPGYVYILQAGPYFKIGRTKTLSRRIHTLRIQLPFYARLLWALWVPDDHVAMEAMLKDAFSAVQRNGEWFEFAHEAQVLLEQVRQLAPRQVITQIEGR